MNSLATLAVFSGPCSLCQYAQRAWARDTSGILAVLLFHQTRDLLKDLLDQRKRNQRLLVKLAWAGRPREGARRFLEVAAFLLHRETSPIRMRDSTPNRLLEGAAWARSDLRVEPQA